MAFGSDGKPKEACAPSLSWHSVRQLCDSSLPILEDAGIERSQFVNIFHAAQGPSDWPRTFT